MKFYVVLYSLTVLTVNFENCFTENLELLIMHNNDMHSRYEQTSSNSGVCKKNNDTSCVGGFARVAHVVREARKAAEEGKGPKVLFLNAGDTYMGTAWFNVHRSRIVSEFLNLLKPDAVSFGNHEFDDRAEGLVPYVEAATFPIVAANLDFTDEPKLLATNVTKSVVLEVEGKKIGVIGYLTLETMQISAPEKVKFEDEVTAIKKESERLNEEGVKIIIALGHSGYEIDQKIAKEVPLVDLVVGGHTDTFLWNGPQPVWEEVKVEGPYPTVVEQSSGKKVPVVQAYALTKYMGRLNIVFNDEGDAVEYSGQPQLLESSIPQDKDVLDLLEVFRPAVIALDKEVVGISRVTLEGGKSNCRHKECNFGNMVADAFVAYHSSVHAGKYWTDAPIAILNGGGIKGSIQIKDNGKITRSDLLEAIPYTNLLYSITLNGSDLLESLEFGVKGDGQGGELLQVSGIIYSFDRSKPGGSRIIEAKARCGLCSVPVYEPILAHRTYRILTSKFLTSGGDGHSVIRDKAYNKVLEDLSDIDTIAWYINKMSPVYPGEEGRLTALKDDNGGRNLYTIVSDLISR